MFGFGGVHDARQLVGSKVDQKLLSFLIIA